MDIRNTFLYGDLDEQIYMDILASLKVKRYKNLVCKLKKSLYGLRQSP